jgi:PAS domain S-box-containing protein
MLSSMNISTENEAMASEKKGIIARLDPRNWGLQWKVRLNFFLGAVVAIGLIIFIINLFQRRIAVQDVNDKLLLVTATKSKYVEDHFAHISQKLASFSTERQTIEAVSQLNEAFLNIENENYFTSTITSLDKINTLVEGFYTAEILPVLDNASDAKVNLQTLLPADNKQRILQYLYLAANSKPMGAKNTLNKADDGSAYSVMHAQYHPELLNFARKTGISDILFVDYKSGYVTYSVKKNLDFATNLFNGPYKNSGLGLAFKNAIGQRAGSEVAIIDESLYVPALYKPQVFMSAPVYSGSQLLGAVIFALSTAELDGLLALEKDGISSAGSLKALIIGNDFLYRSNDPGLLANKDSYVRKLKRNAGNGKTASVAERLGTTALVQEVDPISFADALKSKEGLTSYRSETGEEVLCAFKPLQIDNLDWILVAQMDRQEALSSVRRFLLIMAGISLLIAGLLYYMSGITSNAITERLASLKNNIVSVSKGERIPEAESGPNDEIGEALKAVNKLSKRIEESATFVTEMGKGNIDLDFAVGSDEDHYGISLNNLKKSLSLKREEEEKRRKEDEIRNWTSHGIAMFNDILRSDNNNLEKLSFNITRSIIQYLSANQGGLFLIEEEEEGNKYLNLVASYAYDRQKFLKKKIGIGEGLAGNCALEKKTVLLNRIPDNYIEISSGLGGSKPGCLMIVPLKKEEEVLGVLEMASFNDFKPHEVEFVEKVAESIAASLITVRLHQQTSQYLERFQQQAEEMKAQDEELRQSIEELQATHEQMERLKQEEAEHNQKMIKEMEDYRKLLISVINEIPEKIFVKDDKGRFIIANKPVADNYGKTVEEILGKSDFDFYPKEEAAEYFQKEQDIISSGKTQAFEEGDPSRYDGLIVRSIKKPFFIEHLGITGLFGVQFDISDIKRKEYEATKLAEEIHEKQEELRKEKALLDALLDNVPETIYFKDKESRFIRFSRSMLKLFGLKKEEELLGKSDFDFFADEHARPAFEDEQNIIRTGKAIIDLEEKEVMEDGRVSWVNTTKMPLKDARGNIIGTFGISKDITNLKRLQEEAIERNKELQSQEEELKQNIEEMKATQEDMRRQIEENKRMQEALGKEKALMDALLDNVPENIYFKDKESRFIRFSKSMLKLFGLKKEEELLGKSDFDFFADEHARPAFEDEQNIIRTGKAIIDLEEKEVMEDGRVSWVNTTKMPLRNSKGEIIGTFGISKNISKLKNLETEAREMLKTIESHRKLLIDVLNKIPAKIFLKDENGVFVVVNAAVASIYNKTPEQIIGTSDYDNHPNEDVDSWRAQELEIIKEGEKSYLHLEKVKGKSRYLNTTKMPFVLATTGKTGLLGIQIDVTNLKIMEEEVHKLKAEVERLKK